MPTKSRNPRLIHDAYKEAVVDSILSNLSARLAGRGDFYKVIYGMKPSVALMSEFILPMPLEERAGDEEADPIRISAHGLDFQVDADAVGARIAVAATGAVYVRILPTEDEVKVGGPLHPNFPLNKETRRGIAANIKAALDSLAAALPNGRKNPEWGPKSEAARKAAHEAFGVPFDNRLDRSSVESQDPEREGGDGLPNEATDETTEGEQRALQAAASAAGLPDSAAEEIAPPPKWLRLDLKLPAFEFTPGDAEQAALAATKTLNDAIAAQLDGWAASTDEPYGGQLWGFRHGRPVRPSDIRDWPKYLAAVRSSKLKPVLPRIDVRWVVQSLPDPVDPTRRTIHVALENWSDLPSAATYKEVEPALFQVSVAVDLPAAVHRQLHLDRVKPSYRYNEYLKYPALGFNGGVVMTKAGETNHLQTTWAPRYVLPRVVPTSGAVELRIAELAKPDCLTGLKPLVQAYTEWLERVKKQAVGAGLEGPNAAELRRQEEEKLQKDVRDWTSELAAISAGISILEKSRANWSGPGIQKSPLGIPFEAWTSMNEAMAKVASSKGYSEWRLFQLAFILASLPAFVTRMKEFHDFYTPEAAKHANAVTLLYFATGGGKSEAFLGLLAYVLFLDRLRGKERGVSALMRYPLRLLTLQQARRTFATMGAAEEVRHSRGHPGEPFSLGFWVGGSNTPNWHSADGYNEVKTETELAIKDEAKAMEQQPYKGARERWLKLSSCPFCGSAKGHLLALRRHSGTNRNTLAHFCSAPREQCSWNRRFTEPTPLPFYIVDEDIYDLAPSVLLGTVDKLSALGQSQGTIRKFFGMFGFATLAEKGTDRLFIPMTHKEWEGHPGASTRGLFPAYANGEKRFFDPFPSLLIQDEAHLLDESLGTFAGLFESALEAAFDKLAPLLKGNLSCEPDSSVRRKIKVIAASATVSEPHRQMKNLYQRDSTVQFPHPGPSLYSSFYAAPKQPDASSEDDERRLVPEAQVELRSHWGRVYASQLTNGHRHTVAMASVLGHYHLTITGLYERLRGDDPVQHQSARAELVRWVSPGQLQAQFVRLLENADASTLLTLVDLHRIALTYVTNKKGGDQVIDTEKVQFEKLHQSNGFATQSLASELISGAISAAEIQDIVRRAEKRVGNDQDFPDLNDTLRSVIATSAISHGVDVEEFNAMFFAGIPSDIAEYIQASSRVGRTHVGFSLLVPVPQRYRDRFVLEIHDIFHRFLERMILPAAVDRWAEKALQRVMPSFFQEYVCGMNAIEALCAAADDKKKSAPTHNMALDVRTFLSVPENLKTTEAFMERALGLDALPAPEGKRYYNAMLKGELDLYQKDLEVDRYVNGTRLVRFFEARNSRLRPMTSLRDVDQSGLIRGSKVDLAYRPAPEGAVARAMTFIRRGSGADVDSTDPKLEAKT